ncbi:MAG: hypothetical protein WD771_04745 [Gemmatimonadaceae bacterium]
MTDLIHIEPDDEFVAKLREELARTSPSRKRQIAEKVVLAALGSIPWVGGVLSVAAAVPGEKRAGHADDLRTKWLEEHQRKLRILRETLEEMQRRFDTLGDTVSERVESEEYLAIVRKTFKTWDNADTAEKRGYAANLVTNAAGTRASADDVVRLFIEWLDTYHESHFAVIRHVYANPGATRFDIWSTLYGDLPREDSAEADLFKMLISDLSIGRVIRHERDVNALGQFVRKRPAKRRGPAPATLETAFDDEKPYVLTELGKRFVHYTLSDAVGRLADGAA